MIRVFKSCVLTKKNKLFARVQYGIDLHFQGENVI